MSRKAMLLVPALVVAFAAATAVRGDDKEVKGDLKKLQGAWVYTNPGGEETRWVFEGDMLKSTVNANQYVSKITLDADGKPHPTADFKITEAPDDSAGQTALGIYKLEGDSFTLCVALPGRTARPTEFKRVEDETLLFELKRAK
ncbi:MAG TPA: TIGR03067 domain-containing protein [Isosphaeraceae bacterium]|nr:TIGR03067 domain-containing protein [Isosphaeraceae bacterium]